MIKKLLLLAIVIGGIVWGFIWWNNNYNGVQGTIDTENTALALPISGSPSSKNFSGGVCSTFLGCPTSTYTYSVDPPQTTTTLDQQLIAALEADGYTANNVPSPSTTTQIFATKDSGKFIVNITLTSTVANSETTSASVAISYNPTTKAGK